MFKRRFRLPSPALVISMVTLSLVLGGTAFAATAARHKDAKADTKLVKKLAPALSVKHAKTADSAANATNATNATNASHATSADTAANATNATNASHATSADTAANATTATTAGTNVLQDVNPSDNNIPLSTNSSAPTTINSLVLPGPGTYLIVANGALFPEGAAPSNCDGAFEITVNGTPVSGNQTDAGGTLDAAGNYVESDYVIQRLLNITGASPTVAVVGFKFDGTQTCETYDNVLTVTHVGTASGAVG